MNEERQSLDKGNSICKDTERELLHPESIPRAGNGGPEEGRINTN